ncbi:hypothetical protein ACF0H5_015462 [Mactra antiquata]
MASVLATTDALTYTWLEEEIDEKPEQLTNEVITSVLEEVRRNYDIDTLDPKLDQLASQNNPVVYPDNQPSAPDEDDPETMIKSKVDNMLKSHTKSCANCSKEIRIEDVSQFKIGQHLSMPGDKKVLNRFYKHHAIVKRIVSTEKNVAKLELIHFYSEGDKLQITKSEKEYDLGKDKIYYIKYEQPLYEPGVIITRAEEIRKNNKDSPFKKYNPVFCNCEHFATWCVVDKGESFQVQGHRQKIVDALKQIFGTGSIITKCLIRLVFTSADEIAAGLQGSIDKAAKVTLFVTSAFYLLYCIVMTILHIKKHKNGKMCRSCLKVKLIDLWCGLGAFGITSGISYLFMKFGIPLLGPWPFGVPLVILTVLLSFSLQVSIPWIHQALQSPFTCNKNKLSNLADVKVGDIVSFLYFGLEHVAVVTELNELDHDVTCVHYSLPKLLGTRIVQEETFNLNPAEQSVKLFDCNPIHCKPPHEVVKLARKRVGETKWSCVNRSDHLSYWAKMKVNARGRCDCEYDVEDLTTKKNKEAFLREEDVHLMTDIELGDVVKYKKKGIVVGIKSLDNDFGRQFEFEMIIYNSADAFCRKQYSIDLNKDDLTVFIYHPSFCFPMHERSGRALALLSEKGKWWTKNGFINHCIMLKNK